jgi:hypothetical protein
VASGKTGDRAWYIMAGYEGGCRTACVYMDDAEMRMVLCWLHAGAKCMQGEHAILRVSAHARGGPHMHHGARIRRRALEHAVRSHYDHRIVWCVKYASIEVEGVTEALAGRVVLQAHGS